MNIGKKLLHMTLSFLVFFFVACDRLNMYDIASGKSRTAYAIAFDGVDYTLILANLYYVKTFKLSPVLTNPPLDISVNRKGEVIVFDGSNTILIQNDLTTWAVVTTQPPSYNNVIGLHDSFVCFDITSLYLNQLSENSIWIQTAGPFPANSLDIFNGFNSEIYIAQPNANDVNIYTMNNPGTPLFTANLGISLTNSFGGYRTKNYFYIWNYNNANSIFRITQNTTSSLNYTTVVGNSLIDVTVTDDDKVFVIVYETGQYLLKQIISDNNYPTLHNFGSAGSFNIDSLDSNHLVISSKLADINYNGLVIYNIDDNKIEKHVTTTDVTILYVPR
ncbi:MAG: hypothetical protein N3F66_11795 [Spirochaetes bacterium]|nr:hypothetical protein [Spirochaetota bacterium]